MFKKSKPIPVSTQKKIILASGAIAIGVAHGVACYVLRTPLAILAGASTARKLYRGAVAEFSKPCPSETKAKEKAKAK